MAGNRKFHNKYHSANHHTLPSPHIRDSGLDPIASHEFPFIGDFVLNGVLSASNNYMLNNRALADTLDTVPHGVAVPEGWHVLRDSTYVDGNLTITGNLSALGETTYLHTQVHATSATEIEVYANNSNGVTAGLTVDQWGTNDIVHFKNDGQSVFYITGNRGGTFGDATDGGNIGIGLDRLTPDPENPKTYEQLTNQAMTLVGSLSVVPDPNDTNNDQLLSTSYRPDPGRSGSIYIQGGLHVDEHAYLDQVTIDTTDGPFVVSGGDNTSTANIFEVEVPTELDQVTIDTTDGLFTIEGTNKMLVDNKDDLGVSLDVNHHAQFEQVTITTSQTQPFLITGNGKFEIGDIDAFSIASHTFLSQTTVDVNPGRMYIHDSGTTSSNTKPWLDVDCQTHLDQVTVNTFDGEFLITNDSTTDYVNKNPLTVDVPTNLTKLTVDTSRAGGDMSVIGTGKVLITTSKTEGDTQTGLEVQSNTHLNKLTVDTNAGRMLVTTTDVENILDVEVPTELDVTTIDVEKGNFTIEDTSESTGLRTHQMFVDVESVFERDVIFNLEDNVSTIAITGAGGEFYVNTGTTRFESHVEFEKTDVTYTLGQGDYVTFVPDVDTTGEVQSFVPFNLLNTTLSASNVHFRTGGTNNVKIDGTGSLDITTAVNITEGNSLFVEGQALFELTGDYIISDDTVTEYNSKSQFVVNVPTVTQTITATTTDGPVVISGPDHPFRSESPAEFLGLTDFYNTVTSNNLLQSNGATILSDTEVLLGTTESFRIRIEDDSDNTFVNIEPKSTFESDVHFKQNITVDGNVYLSGGSAGIIHVGNEGVDRVAFDATITTDFIPAIADDLITPLHDLGTATNRWSELHVAKGYLDRTESTVFYGNDLKIDGSVRVQTDDTNDLVVYGSGESKFYNDIVTTAQISANNGPWFFDGEDIESPAPTESYDSDGFSYTAPPAPPPKFNVGTRSLFKSSLTALGPVQIGDLPENVVEQLDQPTLNIYGTTVVRDGNLKIQSDIRHLDDNSTLLRFNKNRIELHVDDESALDVIYKDNRRQININTDVGVFGENEIHDVIGRGIDLHGNMRVTETLSATNLVVDYLTVLEQSSGNVGGGIGGSNFRALSGETVKGATTDYVHSGGVGAQHDGTFTGIEFDALLDSTRDIQKTYSVTFKAKSNDVGLGVTSGDTQTVSYQFAVSWDTQFTEAVVNDVEFGIIQTSSHPFANISAVVLQADDVPYNHRKVRLIVQSEVDCEFFIHNVLTQDRPERIDAVAINDLDVAGDLKVHNDQFFDKLVHIKGPESRLEVDGDTIMHGNLTVDGNLYLSAGMDGIINLGNTSGDNIAFTGELKGDIIPTQDMSSDIGNDTKRIDTVYTHKLNAQDSIHVTGESTLVGDVHIQGDLRVDGDTYLSAAGGVINVGDDQQDVVIFNADVHSDIIPDHNNQHNLGSQTQHWNNLFINTISANEIDTDGIIATTVESVNLSGEELTVNQSALISGDLHAGQDLLVGGDLTVDGRINLKTTGIEENLEIDGLLIVRSHAEITSSMSIDENLLLSGSFVTEQNVEIQQHLTVQGDTEVESLTAAGLHVTNDITTSGDVVTNSLTATGIEISGDAVVDSITVNNDAIVTDNLTVNTVSAEGISTAYNRTTGVSDLNQVNATSIETTEGATFDGDVHIKGDIRVDGNAYLSAADGIINVGDHEDDNVVFNAGVASDLVPDETGTYKLGTTELKWSDIYISDTANIDGDATIHGELSATSIIWGTDGYDSADLDRVLKYFDESQGAYGFAHLTNHWNTNINRPVLRDDELPDKAVGMTHTVSEPASVENPLLREKVFEGHFVHVNSTGQTIVALKDHPSGVFQTGTKVYDDYLDLSTPYDVVRKVNNIGGPNVFLTTDDISDTNDSNKYVTQQQIDEFTQTSEDLDNNTPAWNETKTVVQTYSGDWNDTAQIVQDNYESWSTGSDGVNTIVQNNSAAWIQNVDDTKYALSVKTQILNRGSLYLSTPGDSAEFLAMQSGNVGGDATWDELTYDNAMLLPLDTYVREVIIRGENTSGSRVVVGVHTNEDVEDTNSKEYKYFNQTPTETTAMLFNGDNESKIFNFSSHASGAKLSNMCVSVSADQPLGQSSVTIVYDYQDGDIPPKYRPKNYTLTDLDLPTETNDPVAPGSNDGLVVGDDRFAIDTNVTTNYFTLSAETDQDIANEQATYDYLRTIDYKLDDSVKSAENNSITGYSKLIPFEFSYLGDFTDSKLLYMFGHTDRTDDLLLHTKVKIDEQLGTTGNSLSYINGVSRVKIYDHGLRQPSTREIIQGEVNDWRVIESPIEYLPAPVKNWDTYRAGANVGSGFANYWTEIPFGSEVSHNGQSYECKYTHTSTTETEPGVGQHADRYWKTSNAATAPAWTLNTQYTGDWADLSKVISHRLSRHTDSDGIGYHTAYTSADNLGDKESKDLYYLAKAAHLNAIDGDTLSVKTDLNAVYPSDATQTMGSLGSDVSHLEGQHIDNIIEWRVTTESQLGFTGGSIKRWWIRDLSAINPADLTVKIEGHDTETMPSAWVNKWVLSPDGKSLVFYAWTTHDEVCDGPLSDVNTNAEVAPWEFDGERRSSDTVAMNIGVNSASVQWRYVWPDGDLVPADVQTGDGLWTRDPNTCIILPEAGQFIPDVVFDPRMSSPDETIDTIYNKIDGENSFYAHFRHTSSGYIWQMQRLGITDINSFPDEYHLGAEEHVDYMHPGPTTGTGQNLQFDGRMPAVQDIHLYGTTGRYSPLSTDSESDWYGQFHKGGYGTIFDQEYTVPEQASSNLPYYALPVVLRMEREVARDHPETNSSYPMSTYVVVYQNGNYYFSSMAFHDAKFRTYNTPIQYYQTGAQVGNAFNGLIRHGMNQINSNDTSDPNKLIDLTSNVPLDLSPGAKFKIGVYHFQNGLGAPSYIIRDIKFDFMYLPYSI